MRFLTKSLPILAGGLMLGALATPATAHEAAVAVDWKPHGGYYAPPPPRWAPPPRRYHPPPPRYYGPPPVYYAPPPVYYAPPPRYHRPPPPPPGVGLYFRF